MGKLLLVDSLLLRLKATGRFTCLTWSPTTKSVFSLFLRGRLFDTRSDAISAKCWTSKLMSLRFLIDLISFKVREYEHAQNKRVRFPTR